MEQPNYEPPAPMTADQKAMIEKENHYRQLFAENPNASEIQDPHLMLENVFEHANEFVYQDESADERRVPKLLTQSRKLGLTGTAIVTKQEFQKNWDEFTLGVLNGLDWNNIFVAGGAVLGNLSKDRSGFNSSDIDLFIYGIGDDDEANRKLKHIHQVVTNNTRGRGDVIRTQRAVTILNSYPYRHVQIILRMYKSPAEVLFGFDIDSCTVGFDGRDVWCMPRFKRALTKRYNLVNNSRRSLTYEQRLYKYSKRGFAVAVPNLDKSRVDPAIFTKRVRDVAGLAKLVLLDYTAQRQATGPAPGGVGGGLGGFGGFGGPKKARRGDAVSADGEQASDYNGDLDIPWGPGMQADQILRALNVKDKKQFFAKLNRNKKEGGSADKTTSAAGGRPSHLFEKIFLDQSGGSLGAPAQKPIEWIKNNPAYQDYDNGFQRQLMTGSFHPVVGANWEEGAYGGSGLAVGVLSSTAGMAPGSEKLDAAPASVGGFGLGFGGKGARAVPSKAVAPAKKKKMVESDEEASAESDEDRPAFKPSVFNAKKKTPAAAAEPKPTFGIQKKPEGTSSFGSFGTVPSSAATSSSISSVAASYYAAVGGQPDSPPKPTMSPPRPVASPATATASVNRGGFGTVPAPSTPSSFGGGGVLMANNLSAFGPQPGGGFMMDNQPGSSLGLGATPLGAASRRPMAESIQMQPQELQASQTALLSALQQQPNMQGMPVMPMQMRMPQMMAAPAQLLPREDQAEAKPTTKILLLISLLFKQGRLSADERGKLKDLVITRAETVFAALEVFELDQDLDELVDTLKRICRLG